MAKFKNPSFKIQNLWLFSVMDICQHNRVGWCWFMSKTERN